MLQKAINYDVDVHVISNNFRLIMKIRLTMNFPITTNFRVIIKLGNTLDPVVWIS
jgi:hypothetical protein